MRYADYTVRRDGFCGHLAEPEERGDRAVIVVMGGEQSLLPGRKIAEAFAHHGIAGLAVSLFGAEGLPAGPDRVPLELFEPAAALLDRDDLPRDGYYAYVCAHCAPAFEYHGFFAEADLLRKRSEEIYERNDALPDLL